MPPLVGYRNYTYPEGDCQEEFQNIVVISDSNPKPSFVGIN
jgi:hypothetical protein